MFENHYDCPRCGQAWTDTWPHQCDDDCPTCGARHISPSFSEDAEDDTDDDSSDPAGVPG